MILIKPFRGLRPRLEHAAGVIAPPYDVLNTEEARVRARGKPWSFLHVSKPEIDLPEGTDPYSPLVYAQGERSFQKALQQNVLQRDQKPCYYVYRLVMGTHQQTGVVALASVAAYLQNRIRKHEHTRPQKENDRVKNIEALNAQTGPVFLTYRHQEAVDLCIANLVKQKPEYDLVADDGVVHQLWVVHEEGLIHDLSALFNQMDCLYIADGHHRSAAAARVAARRGTQDSDADAPWNYFLAVLFPDNQMQILDYNRLVRDLNGKTPDQLIHALQEHFDVEISSGAVKPERPGDFGMYILGRWYRLRIKPKWVSKDPVARLDVSVLADHLLEPLLGISDPRRDQRIDFVGGIRGLQELERRVDSGEMAVAFSLFPTQLNELMAVADLGQVMPPKSTWFEPKLADGLISHVLDV